MVFNKICSNINRTESKTIDETNVQCLVRVMQEKDFFVIIKILYGKCTLTTHLGMPPLPFIGKISFAYSHIWL